MLYLPLVGSLLFASSFAIAWEKHQSLMAGILSGIPAGSAIDKPYPAPCPEDDRRIYAQLAAELQLNPKALVLPTALEACTLHRPVTGREILGTAGVVDEPDHGMDQDLPGPVESYDPQDAARWMGGTTGKTSTGFRHMYFGGWQLWHPLKTFQVPARAIGYAPDRAALMAGKARELIHKGGIEAAWGYRVLGWSIHYLQDLAQPFHAVQIPNLGMVPWYAMLKWPPKDGFADLVKETTRTIANYHWAFEAYTYYRLTAQVGKGVGREERSPYLDCLEKPESLPEGRAPLSDDPRKEELAGDPHLLALRTARASVEIGNEVGAANIHFFGPGLKDRSVDIPAGKGEPDYAEMNLRPDLVGPREELTQVTCRALGDASIATRTVIGWATR